MTKSDDKADRDYLADRSAKVASLIAEGLRPSRAEELVATFERSIAASLGVAPTDRVYWLEMEGWIRAQLA